nr:unnamed protein product [Callosobruchus analis]
MYHNKIIVSILEKELHLKRIGESVTFISVTGHARIDGNEKVVRLSKEAALPGQEVESIFKWDVVSKRKSIIRLSWETEWKDFCRNSINQYCKIHPFLPKTTLEQRSHPYRRIQSMYFRCLVGHATVRPHLQRLGLKLSVTYSGDGNRDDIYKPFSVSMLV